jgi:hypothetical protein
MDDDALTRGEEDALLARLRGAARPRTRSGRAQAGRDLDATCGKLRFAFEGGGCGLDTVIRGLESLAADGLWDAADGLVAGALQAVLPAPTALLDWIDRELMPAELRPAALSALLETPRARRMLRRRLLEVAANPRVARAVGAGAFARPSGWGREYLRDVAAAAALFTAKPARKLITAASGQSAAASDSDLDGSEFEDLD